MLGKTVVAGALGVLVAVALPASAADQGVSFGPGLAYTPAEVHIVAGESVTFTPNSGQDFATGAGATHHPLDFEDASIPDQTSGTTAVTRMFAQPGTYVFFCQNHRAQGMEGRVIVDAAAPPPGTTTSTSTSTTAITMTTSDGTTTSSSQTSVSSFSSDGSAPKVTIRQTIVTTVNGQTTTVQFSTNEPGTASATLTGRGAVLARGSKAFKKAGRQSLPLKLTVTGRKLLRRSSRLKGKLQITVRDVAGNTTKLSRTLTLAP